MDTNGNLLIIAGPTCSGKDQIIEGALVIIEDLYRAMKYTTRPRVPKREPQKIEYRFLSPAMFLMKKRMNRLYKPYAKNGHEYALNKEDIVDITLSGCDVVTIYSNYREINRIRSEFDELHINVIATLVMADRDAILNRLHNRPDEEVDKRKKSLADDLGYLSSSKFNRSMFDYLILNGSGRRVEDCVKEFGLIVEQHRNRSDKSKTPSRSLQKLKDQLQQFDFKSLN